MPDESNPESYLPLYLSLDETHVWARTRDHGLVARVANSRNPVRREIEIRICQQRGKRNGRDINAELWGSEAVSVVNRPGEDGFSIIDPVAGTAAARLNFHFADHLLQRLRAGRIRSWAKSWEAPEATRYLPTSAAEWKDWKIEERDGALVAVPVARDLVADSRNRYEIVPERRLRVVLMREDVLREFPAEPPVDVAAAPGAEEACAAPRLEFSAEALAQAPGPTEPVPTATDPASEAASVRAPTDDDILALLRPELEQTGKLSQERAYEIMHDRYPQEPRKKARDLAKSLTQNTKRGPQRLQNN
jgi:hypothetical protein